VRICSECCASIRDPECGDCVHYAAALQHAQQRVQKSAKPERHFIAEVSDDVSSAVETALGIAQKGNPKKALAMLTPLLTAHPLSHDLHYGIGTIHLVQGEPHEAIRYLAKAVDIYPYFMEAYYNMAAAYRELRDPANFIRCYRKVLEVGEAGDPDVENARSLIEEFSAQIRRTQDIGLDEYLKANELFNEAFARMNQGDWAGALDLFALSARIHERSSQCHGNMGLCHAYLGRKAKALAELDRALEVDPEYAFAKANRKVVEMMEEGQPLRCDFTTNNPSPQKKWFQRWRKS
jgi:tetratricopeptide (TPR) repeat protein